MIAKFNSNKSFCDKEAIKQSLSNVLPSYMIPSHLAVMDSLPLTANGKLDRKSLPIFEIATETVDHQSDEALDELEELLLASCREIIGNSNMGVTDDFFVA